MYDQLDFLNIAFASLDAAPKTPYSSKKPIEEATRLLLFAA